MIYLYIYIRIMYYPYIHAYDENTFDPTYLCGYVRIYIYISCKQRNFLEMKNPSSAKEQVAQSTAYLVSYGPFTNPSRYIRIRFSPYLPKHDGFTSMARTLDSDRSLQLAKRVEFCWYHQQNMGAYVMEIFPCKWEQKRSMCRKQMTKHSSCVFGWHLRQLG